MLLLLAAAGALTGRADFYGTLFSQSTDSLLRMARQARLRSGRPDNDTTMVCLSIASSRYSPQLTASQKLAVAQAATELYYVKRQQFAEMPKCMALLRKANGIYEELGINRAEVCLNLGAMYQIMGNGTHDDKYNFLALDTYGKGLRRAMQEGKAPLADTLMLCVLNVSQSLGCLDSVQPAFRLYRDSTRGRPASCAAST